MGLIPGVQSWFNVQKSMSPIMSNKLNEKDHTMKPGEQKKHLTKCDIMMKTLSK